MIICCAYFNVLLSKCATFSADGPQALPVSWQEEPGGRRLGSFRDGALSLLRTTGSLAFWRGKVSKEGSGGLSAHAIL